MSRARQNLISARFRGILDGVEALGGSTGDYFKNLAKRGKESKAYSAHQLAGLELADILGDRAHTALYIKIAKQNPDHHRLMILAKDIAGKPSVQNKGAYFMRLLYNGKKDTHHQQ